MLKKWVILLLTATFCLSACQSPVYNQTEGNIADARLKSIDARHKFDAQGKSQPSLVVKNGLYVDTTPISLDRQPSWLRNRIIIRGDQLPFSYYSRTIANGASGNILTKYQTGLDPSINVTLNYTGTLKGALDLLASKSGYVYNVRGNTIYWQAFITKTFDIAFMPGGTDYLMGKASGSAGSAANSASTSSGGSGGSVSNYVNSDSSDSEYSSLKGTLSIWKDLEITIKELLSPQGKVVVSESTTTVTVRDRPTNVELVSQYIHNLNGKMSKQVLVRIQVIEVNLENTYDFGIDWFLIARAFHNTNFVVDGNYGTPLTSIRALSPQNDNALTPSFGTRLDNPNIVPGYKILFKALNQQGKTSIVSEPRVVCLNNQVSVVRIVRSEGYVASIQNTSLSGTGNTTAAQNTVTSQVTPGTVITGLTLYILPKILDNKIFLQVNADLSTNEGVVTLNGTAEANSQIQAPRVTEKHFNQRSMIRSGDTLVLSGFRQVANGANANQFLTSQALGGKASSELNRETIVLITPVILNGNA